MRKYYSFFKWAGIFIVISLLLLLINNIQVLATGETSASFQSASPASAQDALLTEKDLPGFRQAWESEGVGYLAFAKRFTSGLTGTQTAITNISTFRIKDPFQSEYIISFLAYPISEKDALGFDALANDPRSILEALTVSAQTSGNTPGANLLANSGDLGEKSIGFFLALGQEPVAQNIEFLWVRRGTIIQSLWVIYPIGQTPPVDLHQLGLLLDQRVSERFPGTVFRPAGLLVPEITTNIPTPLDISTRPAVIGTNLLLAALMMLPFALAAEVFTRISAENEELLRDKFKPTRWLLALPRRIEKFLGTILKHQGTGGNILRVLLIIFFYGLAFSLLDRTWNPFSITGLVLFLNMSVAYGIVGIADDLVQWRVLKKWGKPAEITLRPTNIFIAAASTITSRLFTLVPGLMFGTPEALAIDETSLEKARRNYLLKISAFTFLGIGFGLWALTTLTSIMLRQNISEVFRNIIGGLEGFLLVVFAVALENTFVQMLGMPGSFGEAIRTKSRWLWALGLTFITFAFYHTLINPRGELSAAMQESNVRIFLGAAGAFVVFTLSFWAYLKIKGRKPTGDLKVMQEKPRTGDLKKVIPAWVWLAVAIIVVTVVSDILITRHNQQVLLANTAATLEAVASNPTALPPPVIEGSAAVDLSFTAPVLVKKLCFLPAVDTAENIEDAYTWRGVQLAAAQYGAQAEYVNPETPDDAGYTKSINQLIQDGCTLTIGNYAPQGQAIMKVAAENPDQNFMLVGGGSDLPNVWVTKYSLTEQAYLAGYLAAAASRSGKVGTFGDPQIQNVVSSMNCFALGVQDFNKAQQANVTVLGWDGNSMLGLFLDSSNNLGQESTFVNDLISEGADIIFPLAGSGGDRSSSGIIATINQNAGVYLIGVGLDWAWAMPESAGGTVTSAETRYDQSIAIAADALARDDFSGGVHAGNLASGEISLSPLRPKFSGYISPQVNDQMVNQSNPDVISKEIDACEIHQTIGGFLNLKGIDGYNWPALSRLTIRIFSAPGGALVFTGSTLSDKYSNFFQQVNVDLVPGMVVEVGFGAETSSVILAPLTVDVVDPVTDTVSGTALAGAEINISLGDIGTDIHGNLSVTASNDGFWQASLSGNYDINSQTGVQVTVQDANGNETIIKTQVK